MRPCVCVRVCVWWVSRGGCDDCDCVSVLERLRERERESDVVFFVLVIERLREKKRGKN